MLLPVIVVLIALFGCAGGGSGEPGMRINEDADGGTLELTAGMEFTAVLESNPTTGYMWAVVEVDGAVLETVANNYFADPAPEMVTGTGGREEWVFRAVAAGSTTLRMQYRRSWKPDDPDGEFTVTVTVE